MLTHVRDKIIPQAREFILLKTIWLGISRLKVYTFTSPLLGSFCMIYFSEFLSLRRPMVMSDWRHVQRCLRATGISFGNCNVNNLSQYAMFVAPTL